MQGTCRIILLEQCVKLQDIVISILMRNDPISALIHPDHNLLYEVSTSARAQSLSALTDQFQRLRQAAPIPPAPPSIRLDFKCHCLAFESDCAPGSNSSELHCSTCGWKGSILIPDVSSHTVCIMAKYHARGQHGRFQCCDCDFKEVCSGERFQRHLVDDHGYTGRGRRRDKRWFYLVR